MGGMQVLFLGAGDAFCTQGRHQAGYLVRSADTTVLLDCGATTLASLKREGIRTGLVDAIFISHLHGDHFAGLPFLFLDSVYVEPRERPLMIAGPPGTPERVEQLFAAMYRDSAARPLPFELQFLEMRPGRRLELDTAAVGPFQVPHQENEISLAFTVEIDGRRILYSGDTGWTEDLVEHSQDTDLFICECCFYETRVPFHLDYPRLAENRHRFGSRRTILTHLGREVLARRNRIEMELAHDGLSVEI